MYRHVQKTSTVVCTLVECCFTGGESKILSLRIQLFCHMTLNLVKFEMLRPEILEDAFFTTFLPDATIVTK